MDEKSIDWENEFGISEEDTESNKPLTDEQRQKIQEWGEKKIREFREIQRMAEQALGEGEASAELADNISEKKSNSGCCPADARDTKMLKIIKRYFPEIKSGSSNYCSFYCGRNIPVKLLEKMVKRIDRGIAPESVIGVIDTTLRQSGRSGYIFTDKAMYVKCTLEKTKKYSYKFIDEAEVLNDGKHDSDKSLQLLCDGAYRYKIIDIGIAKTPLKQCLEELAAEAKAEE